MPTFNTDLAERTLTQIKDHPETWDQESWVEKSATCGTAYCFAGHALAQLGYTPAWERNVDTFMKYNSMIAPDGRLLDVEHTAQKELGLTRSRAFAMFAGGNTLDDLERYVKHFANEPDTDSLPVFDN